MEEEIIAYVAGGATAPAAAKAVGIHPRTLNDWRQRGEERHPTRAPSPRYRRFATRLRQAEGRSRILAEIELRHRDPRHYLARTARATEYDEGWADAPITRSQGGLPALASLTDEELDAALGRLTAALGELQGPSTAPPPSPAKRKGRR